MNKAVFLIITILCTWNPTISQELEGEWYGRIETSYFFVVYISADQGTVQAKCDLQIRNHVRYLNIPVSDLTYISDSLKFSFILDDTAYIFNGRISERGHVIEGYLSIPSRDRKLSVRLSKEKPEIDVFPHKDMYDSEEVIYTRQDTLRGSITPERAWWDVTYYHLKVSLSLNDSTIKGENTIQYKVIKASDIMQIDLQDPLVITKVTRGGEDLTYKKDGNAWFITLNSLSKPGTVDEIIVHYYGKPIIAERPPWQGGFTWEQDINGKPFIATSCQGIGASIWWPNKDHMYDEVDSMMISIDVPVDLTAVANGRLRSVEKLERRARRYNWFVGNPINNYGVNINIADYAHFSEKYQGVHGELDCDYYVLRENLEKAKIQFKQVKLMLDAFEYWFGPYPFYDDGYKLVEVPYLGMEHQSSVTYGNQYENGYLGRDLSGSGWGLKFDYIIIHESGHEWFANNITYKDVADMWVHEGFTSYSEGLYLEYHYGEDAADEYIRGLRKRIRNDTSIIGPYNVNKKGSGDMYAKGANILHTIRQIVDDKDEWRDMLRGLNKTFYHSTVTSREIEDYISEKSGIDLHKIFDQYLRTDQIPIFEYYFSDGDLNYRWTNVGHDFDMPLKVEVDGSILWLQPKTFWTKHFMESIDKTIKIDPNFYIGSITY